MNSPTGNHTQPAGSAPPAQPMAEVLLEFDDPNGAEDDPVAHDISATARKGETLFLAADECAYVETLQVHPDGRVGAHRRTLLSDLFKLPEGSDEMDIEGLAVEDDWLWIVGSHSLTRKKPDKGDPIDKAAIKSLAKLKDCQNRMFIGRAPLSRQPGEGERFALDAAPADERRPQMLKIGKHGSKLIRLLAQDKHLGPFVDLPAKENGLDIEGLIVEETRIGLGLRGPVINGWALVLELCLKPNSDNDELKVKGGLIKHWLDLGGLGIRDLKRDGEDVLVLAGPTMSLDGPVRIYRWRNWRSPDPENLVQRPERVLELPYGDGCDHPEALAPWSHDGQPALLVVCDKPGKHRLRPSGMVADVFA